MGTWVFHLWTDGALKIGRCRKVLFRSLNPDIHDRTFNSDTNRFATQHCYNNDDDKTIAQKTGYTHRADIAAPTRLMITAVHSLEGQLWHWVLFRGSECIMSFNPHGTLEQVKGLA